MTDHVLGNKIRLHTFIKIEIIQNMFSEYSEIMLEISNNKITWKTSKYLKNKLLNNHLMKKEITKELRKCFEPSDNKNHIKTCGIKLKTIFRRKRSFKCLNWNRKKISNTRSKISL